MKNCIAINRFKAEEFYRTLNVEHLTHGFGDRAIFDDVSFRLLKGEHIGLVGRTGKSTFMNIVTGKLMPDKGKVELGKACARGLSRPAFHADKGHDGGECAKVGVRMAV